MPSSNSDDSGAISKFKRTRRSQACDTCRKKKLKCSGPKPPDDKCLVCIERNCDCTYNYVQKKPGTPSGYLERIEKRVKLLEGILRKLCPTHEALNDTFCFIEEAGTESYSSNTAKSPSPAAPSASRDILSRYVSHNLQSPNDPFQDDDFDHIDLSEKLKCLSLQSNERAFWGKSSGFKLIESAVSLKNSLEKDSTVKRTFLQNRRPVYWTRPFWIETHITRPSPKYMFPPPLLIAKLTDTYFDHVNLQFPLLHRPTFKRSVNEMLHLRDSGFGGVLLMVCAVGSRYTEDDVQFSAGWKWFSQVEVVKDRFLKPPTLYDLQSYCLAMEYLQWSNNQQAIWTMVGFGLRLAQDMGIHRKRRVPHERMTVEDELLTRAFWILLSVDRWNSLGAGRPCALFDHQFDVDMPVECDDEYWEHPDPRRRFKQPEGVPCTITAFNHLLRLDKIIAFALETIYGIKSKLWEFLLQDPQWEQRMVSEIDSALENWLSSLPSFFRWVPNRTPSKFFTLSAALAVRYYNVKVLIHRPYIQTQGSLPSPFSLSASSICSREARSCALILQEQLKRSIHIYPYMQMTALSMAITLLVEMWAGDDTDAREYVGKCVDVFRIAQGRWRASGIIVDILDDLIVAGKLCMPHDPTQVMEMNLQSYMAHIVSTAPYTSSEPNSYNSTLQPSQPTYNPPLQSSAPASYNPTTRGVSGGGGLDSTYVPSVPDESLYIDGTNDDSSNYHQLNMWLNASSELQYSETGPLPDTTNFSSYHPS